MVNPCCCDAHSILLCRGLRLLNRAWSHTLASVVFESSTGGGGRPFFSTASLSPLQQVLYEAEESVVEGVWTPPKAVATPTQTVESFRSLFEEWKRRLGGGNELALRLLTRHVDPVVFAQFQEKLS
ncbi:unnamed protein product [Mesocestoides corti]|uniref:Uncharacterized protein n=1 Tax=Mesocestoides corti TaxID=53468 RepID=A0A0R3UNJ4_MESCO|nr:unnamed protein product [Mesocestoides corti]